MKEICFFLIVMATTINATFCQNEQNEFAIGVFGYEGPIYKRVQESKALRLGISLTRSNTDNKIGTTLKNQFLGFALSTGYEIRQKIGDDFTLYYGGDIVTSFSQAKVENIPNSFTLSTKERSLGFTIVPIIGIYYHFSKTMFFLTDVRFSTLNYSLTKRSEVLNRNNEERITTDSRRLALSISPSYSVGVGFRF
ncbi:hypothetical protein [Runella salmonicolor]|uniref:Outer membrane protein beta-barrel domain-containing protein n=1 Tax=Runella salmonicolor TaxID=2950278 RepID=A0ABT1FLR1_9BACT|nr:hypothetical protein [Runella salmonicolor]MCP1382699.1 hypothetical protein [Runella salmonicolor]